MRNQGGLLVRALVVTAIVAGMVVVGAAWREAREPRPTDRAVAVLSTADPGVSVAPSATPDSTAPPRWIDGRSFMTALTEATGTTWSPGRVEGTMTASGPNGARVYVLPAFDDAARVVVEEVADVPSGETFETVLGIIDPESVPWLEQAYAELAPVAEPDGYGTALDLATGQVAVTHIVRDDLSTWRLSLIGRDWAPPEPSEPPIY